jgi:hypothetical protein
VSEANRNVFVSYAHEDLGLCRGLVEELRAKGFEVWTDEQLPVGRSFNESIANSIFEARAVVLISTGYSQQSEYIGQEIGWALDLGKTVCEVSVAGCSRKELKDKQRVEFEVGAGTEAGWREVVHKFLPDLKRAIGPSEIFIAHELVRIPKFCFKCGEPNAMATQFCLECGEQLLREAGPPDPTEKAFVDWMVSELQEHGLDCWYEQGKNFVGKDRNKMIDDAIDRAGVNLAITSEVSVRSKRFCAQIKRALHQDDDVVWTLHHTPGTSKRNLIEAWRSSMRLVVSGEPDEEQIMKKFEDVVRSDPAWFDHKDRRQMRNLVETLREKQDHYRVDPQQAVRDRKRMEEFIAAAEKRGLNPARVLNLPDDRTSPGGGATAADRIDQRAASGDTSDRPFPQTDQREVVETREDH